MGFFVIMLFVCLLFVAISYRKVFDLFTERSADMVKIIAFNQEKGYLLGDQEGELAIILHPPYHKEYYTANNPRTPFKEVKNLRSAFPIVLPLSCFVENKQNMQKVLSSEKIISISINYFVNKVLPDDLVKIVINVNNNPTNDLVGCLDSKSFHKYNPQMKKTFKVLEVLCITPAYTKTS